MQYNIAKSALSRPLFPKGKRGISNIALMIGIVIAIIFILVLGLNVMFKTLELRAGASSETLATELALIADTVQASPEPITVTYFTPIVDGFPAIGSLEIDDDLGKLCVSSRTEHEMYEDVVDRASGQAGFATAAIGIEKSRQILQKRAAAKLTSNLGLDLQDLNTKLGPDLAANADFNHLMSQSDTQSKAFRRALADPVNRDFFSMESSWLRQRNPAQMAELKRSAGVAGGGFDARLEKMGLDDAKAKRLGYGSFDDAARAYRRMLTRESLGDLTDEISKRGPRSTALKKIVKGSTSLGINSLFRDIHDKLLDVRIAGKAVKFTDFLKKSVSAGVSRLSKFKFWFLGNKQSLKAVFSFTKSGKVAKVYERVSNGLATLSGRSPVGKGRAGAAIFFSAVVVYGLTQDDYKATSLALLPFAVSFNKGWIIKYLAQRGVPRLATYGSKVVLKQPVAFFKRGLLATGVGAPGAGLVWAIETVFNVIDSVYTILLFDVELLGIRDAAGSQINEERRLLTCKEFSTSTKPLLYPANCVPNITYADPNADFETRDTKSASEKVRSLEDAREFSTIFKRLVSPRDAADFLGALADASLQVLKLAVETIGSIVNNIGSALGELIQFKNPRPDCLITDPAGNVVCDQVYERRDCPNYYVSQPRNDAIPGEALLFSIGAACIPAIPLEWGYDVCSITQLVATMSLYINSPEIVQSAQFHMYDIGLNKKVGQKQVAFSTFANNEGYWYAEFPAVIEFTKVYNNETAQPEQNLAANEQLFIISKAA